MEADEPSDWSATPSSRAFDDPRANLYAVPLAFAAAWPLNAIGIGMIPQLFYHEFGHAAAAWLCGRWAFPIPIAGLTFLGTERSYFVSIAFAALLAWIFKRAWETDRRAVLVFALAGLLAMLDLALVGSDPQTTFVLYGGCAGEIVLSAAAIVAFYYDVSRPLRWDFWRWPLLLSAACMFLHAATFWNGLHRLPDDKQLDQELLETQDNDADWAKLVHEHGWTTRSLVDNYFLLTKAGAAVVSLHFVLFAFRRRSSGP